jgi:hypothetical protein
LVSTRRGSGPRLEDPGISPQRLFGGIRLRLTPSNSRFARCLPFSDFVFRPREPSPLGPPCFALQIREISLLPRLALRFADPCPLASG